jgi:L-threonylcarbamoyladenylate synthase
MADDERIDRAVEILSHDGLVVYPTDTIYGLGADALSEEAIEKVYAAKQRPYGMPISIAVSDEDMLAAVSRIDSFSRDFVKRFLPGPVTVVVPARKSIPPTLTGGTGVIGIRWPASELALELVHRFDSPVMATSANLHGAKDPVTPDEVTVPRDFTIDGGRLPGTPSTVVDLTTRMIIRRGAMADEVTAFLAER